jgi:hypothetical protein
VLLAVPAAAVLKILLRRLTARYRGSGFYTGRVEVTEVSSE